MSIEPSVSCGASVSNEPHILIEDVEAVYDAADGDLAARSTAST